METYIPNRRILYVDDEEGLLLSFKSMLRKENFEIHLLQHSTQIEDVLHASGPFAVVLSDQRMPELDGVGVLETVLRIHPATIRIMVTGFSDHHETLRAINVGGISRYISKPWNDDELRSLVTEAVTRYNLAEENKFLVEELSIKNKHLSELLEGTVSDTVRLLGEVIGYVNPEIAKHAAVIRKLGKAVLDHAKEIAPEEQWQTLRALDLCFLGIAVLPPWIQVSLNKQGLVAMDRFPIAKNHHLLGASLLKDIPRFKEVSRIILLQAKDFNGYGEPLDEIIKGTQIPFGARLLHILTDLVMRSSTTGRDAKQILQQMETQPNKYDTSIISILLGKPTAASSDVEREVYLHDLKPGMVVLETLETNDRQKLITGGTVLTETSVKFLKQWSANEGIKNKILVKIPKQELPRT